MWQSVILKIQPALVPRKLQDSVLANSIHDVCGLVT
jgi:hypothetical protein